MAVFQGYDPEYVFYFSPAYSLGEVMHGKEPHFSPVVLQISKDGGPGIKTDTKNLIWNFIINLWSN